MITSINDEVISVTCECSRCYKQVLVIVVLHTLQSRVRSSKLYTVQHTEDEMMSSLDHMVQHRQASVIQSDNVCMCMCVHV